MVEPRPDKWMSAADRHCRRAIVRVHSYRIVHARVRYLDGATPYSSRPGGESVQGFRNEQPIADYAGRREIVRLRNVDRHGSMLIGLLLRRLPRIKKKKKNSIIKAIAREATTFPVTCYQRIRTDLAPRSQTVRLTTWGIKKEDACLCCSRVTSSLSQSNFNRSQLLQIHLVDTGFKDRTMMIYRDVTHAYSLEVS